MKWKVNLSKFIGTFLQKWSSSCKKVQRITDINVGLASQSFNPTLCHFKSNTDLKAADRPSYTDRPTDRPTNRYLSSSERQFNTNLQSLKLKQNTNRKTKTLLINSAELPCWDWGFRYKQPTNVNASLTVTAAWIKKCIYTSSHRRHTIDGPAWEAAWLWQNQGKGCGRWAGGRRQQWSFYLWEKSNKTWTNVMGKKTNFISEI